MAKKQAEVESGGNWMDTYGDMVTLLLTFFVALFSMAVIDDEKWLEILRAFNPSNVIDEQLIQIYIDDDGHERTSFPTLTIDTGKIDPTPENPIDFSGLLKKLEEMIEENNRQDDVTVTQNPDRATNGALLMGHENIYIQFSSDMLFHPDSSVMLPEGLDILQFMGETLAHYESEIALIVIKGHTAVAPTPVDSRKLSLDRSWEVSNYFQKTCSIKSTLLKPLGLGNDFPLPGADNDTEEGRAKNRRVEIVVIPKTRVSEEWEMVFGDQYRGESAGNTFDIMED